MTRLTEEMVVARSRVSDIGAVKKLNCWGGELNDVSILRRMHNLEVLSISVNKISSLVDFQNLMSLRELYVRNNEVSALNQICYLQNLPQLKVLWLAENPCANELQYRLTVLKALPNLQKLDDVMVQPEEVEDAIRKGRDLVHPEEEPSPPPPLHNKRSPTQKSAPVEFVEEVRCAQPPRMDRSSPEYEVQRVPSGYQPAETEEMEERYASAPHPYRRPSDLAYQAANTSPPAVETGNGNGVCDKCWSPVSASTPQPGSPSSNTPLLLTTNSSNNGLPVASPTNDQHNGSRDRRGSSASSNDSNKSSRSRSHTESPPSRPVRASTPEDALYSGYTYTRETHSSQMMGRVAPSRGPYVNGTGHDRRWPEPPKRTATATNLLTAVLCLVMELDYDELVQVERTLTRRKQEMLDHRRHSP